MPAERKLCRICGTKKGLIDNLCYTCWRGENPGKAWPWGRKAVKGHPEPPIPRLSQEKPFDERAQRQVYKLIDPDVLEDVLDMIDSLCKKRNVTVGHRALAEGAVTLYTMIVAEGKTHDA